MPTIKKCPATTAVPFPRAINPGVNSVKVNFDDFSLEVRDVETMGPVEIIHQKANPKVALQVVHTKDLGDFDKMLDKAMGMHVTSQYITGDYSFFVLFSGIHGDFAKNETDLHVRMPRLFDAIRGGASWYQHYRDKLNTKKSEVSQNIL